MIENALSIFQCGFCRKYSTQHALIAMIEKARKILDKGGTFGALFNRFIKSLIVYDTWPSYSKIPCTELWYECVQLDV